MKNQASTITRMKTTQHFMSFTHA